MRPRSIATIAAFTIGLSTIAIAPASAAPEGELELTLLSTTDIHGHIYNWDYFADTAYTKPADILGMTRVATVVKDTRQSHDPESVFVFDNGDAIQGTPLTSYYGMDPVAADVIAGTVDHPMATAFNEIGYDAQVLGNHEFNYGLDLLGAYTDQLDAPMLGANVLRAADNQPAFTPYTLIPRTINGQNVTVGVIGLVTPGVRVWDRDLVEGRLVFQDMVDAARQWVPVVAAQADVVVVLAHTGVGTVPAADYDPTTLEENTVNDIAELVPGIDVIVSGHTHLDRPSTIYTNTAGENVLVTQPYYWARSVSEVTLTLVPDPNDPEHWKVDWATTPPAVTPHYGKDVAEDTQLHDDLWAPHQTTLDYVNSTNGPVAVSLVEMSTATSRYEDTPILDFIAHVETETVANALVGTAYEGVPIVAQATPFSRTAVFPQGEVTLRNVAGLYIYDNTLRAVLLTGSELKEYLEYSARFFSQLPVGAQIDPETITHTIPDYNYDALSGVNYAIDVSQPVGSRIVGLSYPDGTPVGNDDQFVYAVNNYRQSGGGSFPYMPAAPVIYDEQKEIRQLLIDWASARGVIDPADFAVVNWTLRTTPLAGPTTQPTASATPSTGGAAPAPTTVSGQPTATSSSSASNATALPRTGASGWAPLAWAGALTLLGLIGLVVRRSMLR